MTTTTLVPGTRTQISGAAAALNSLANNTYVVIGTVTFISSGKVPLDVKLELFVTPGSIGGNKQLVVFMQESLDGTNFVTGPTSGTSNVDEANLTQIGTIPLNTNSTLQRGIFTLAQKCGGAIPYGAKIIVRNESNAALAGSGNDAYISTYVGDTQ